MARSPRKPKRTPPPPLLEWITAGLGLVVVLIALVMIGRQVLTGHESPPDVRVAAMTARPGPAGWTLEIQARNLGDRTAAGVQVQGRLGEETASVEFDYVPAHGHASGTLRFNADPRAGVELSVLGWREP